MEHLTVFCGILVGKHYSKGGAADAVGLDAGWGIVKKRETSLPAMN
jgi:hypothetical protein